MGPWVRGKYEEWRSRQTPTFTVCRKRIKKKHHDPKAEEGRDFKKEGKTGRVKAAKEQKTTILDEERGPQNSRLKVFGDL